MSTDESNNLDEQDVDPETLNELAAPFDEEDSIAEPIDLKDLLIEAERERDQFHELAKRSQADLSNYKKRIDEERKDERKYFNVDLLGKLISISDDLNRVNQMDSEQNVDPAWRDGIDLVYRNLTKIIQSQGLEKIDVTAKSKFNPHEHQAVLFQDSKDFDEGSIIEVVQDGYKLHDRLIRATQVIVAKNPGNLQENTEKNSEV